MDALKCTNVARLFCDCWTKGILRSLFWNNLRTYPQVIGTPMLVVVKVLLTVKDYLFGKLPKYDQCSW